MLNDLKEFEKFLKICRKQGVTDVTFAGVSVKLGDLPTKASEASESEDNEEIHAQDLSPEQLMYLAVNGGA